MPNMANMTVKKNDGTTDVVYTAVVPSAGDKTPAVWQNQTVGTAQSHRPELKVSSRDNGTNTARRIDLVFTYPTLVTDGTGKVTVADKLIFNGSWLKPKGMPDSDVNEGVSQLANAIANALLKDTAKTGYAPT